MTGLRVSLFLAARSVARSNYGIAWATALMMLLIYVSLLFLPSLIQGAINRVNEQLVDTLTSNIVITPGSKSTSIGDVNDYLAAIRRTTGVADATAVYHVGIEVSYGASTGSWSVIAIDPASYANVFTTPRNVIDGGPLTEHATGQVLLGIGIAGSGETSVRGYRASLQDVFAGDRVSLTFIGGRSAPFTVVGIYDNQFPQSDNNAFITLYEAQRLDPAIANHATAIYVRTRPGADVNQVARRLTALAPRASGTTPAPHGGVNALTSTDLGAAVQDQVATYRLISDILKVISLLMAAITIFTITYIDVVHRRRQIGVERAIGIRSVPIVTSYVLKAWAYAIAGIAAGFVIFRFAVVPFVSSHPFQFPDGPVALAATSGEMIRDLVFLVVVAALAALAPALRSVRIPILDSIWAP
ncbi:MAG TPA: ABC transporter permease [Streptosporangiaceae bacterium]|nr:ABC transporter permease [Streptosporangiaceae bacterium]